MNYHVHPSSQMGSKISENQDFPTNCEFIDPGSNDRDHVGVLKNYETSYAPMVVISDYSSSEPVTRETTDVPNGYDTEDYMKFLLNHKQNVRKASTCSSCSSLSYEFEDDRNSCNDVFDPGESCNLDNSSVAPRPPSGWRKVRNVVHWSPFVQTYKNHKYRWVQLAGHQGNFRAGEQGTILKKLCYRENTCLQNLMKDILKPYVPDYKGEVDISDEKFVQFQDLLANFQNPCVMDIKMGVRTYLEEELAKAKENIKLRKDMYEKMVQIDPYEPTDEEHKLKAITKPRYMLWRETISSTASLGFRIEGVKKGDGTSSKDFKTTKTKDQVSREIIKFTEGFPSIMSKYTKRLIDIKEVLQRSSFFKNHEFIGSSLLFVHDQTNANIWLIDFAKTLPIPEGLTVDHKSSWIVGNHEDGYLIGLENLISIFNTISST